MLGHWSSVSCVAITSDNKYIVSGGHESTVRIWNLLDKTQEAVLLGHWSSVSCVSITSDNKYIVSGDMGGSVRIWNLETKEQEALFINVDDVCLSNLKYSEIEEVFFKLIK